MNTGTPSMMDKALENGIIQKGTIHAVAERMRSFEQRFDERPKICVSQGSLPAHQQIDVQFFQRDQQIELSMSPEDGFLHMRNLSSNTIIAMDFETHQGIVELESSSGPRSLSIEYVKVGEDSRQDMPEFCEKLSKVVLVDNDGESIEGLKEELGKYVPWATFVERSQFNEHFLVNQVIGNNSDRQSFCKEFEESTGPRMVDVSNKRFATPVHDTPSFDM